MKQVLALIVLLLVFGLVAFIYRYELEQPHGILSGIPGTSTTTPGAACQTDAKICPDGSAVGRTGPNCSFATCPPPNVEIANGSTTLSFVLPAGYKQLEQGTPNQTTLRIYQKPITGDQYHVLTISAYPIPVGGSATSVMLAQTVFDPSGIQATSTSRFTQITIGSHSFERVDIGRFEGQVETAYYLATATNVYKFDLIERGVTNWTDPNLNTTTLPEHKALAQMLATLQLAQ